VTDLIPPIALVGLGGVAAAFAAGLVLWLLGRAARLLRRYTLEDLLTVAAASIATGVSAQGMWQFSGDVLGFDGPLRLLLFAFIEVAVITSAVRARASMLAHGSAGVDGVAVWVLTCLSAVLSALDAHSGAEAVFRLAAPLVAAWLWERGMALERRRITGLRGIHWRITPERILVRLGLAEVTDRTAAEVATDRMLTKVARAAAKVRRLIDAGAPDRTLERAYARLVRIFERAVTHTDVLKSPERRAELERRVQEILGVRSLPLVAPSEWRSGTGTAALPSGTGTAAVPGTVPAAETGTAERGTGAAALPSGTGTAPTGTDESAGTEYPSGTEAGTGTAPVPPSTASRGTAAETGTGTGDTSGTATAGTGPAETGTGTGDTSGTATAGTGPAERGTGTAPARRRTGTRTVIPLDELTERERRLAEEYMDRHPGHTPTKEEVRREFGIGSTAANRVRAAIVARRAGMSQAAGTQDQDRALVAAGTGS